jgi:hypothetical protein
MLLGLQYTTPTLQRSLRDLVPGLGACSVERLTIASTARPGEPPYLVAFAYVDGRRHAYATPELRHLPLAEQEHDLLQQLRGLLSAEST